ncbi:hypothetical protein DV738_g5036, partial [Chaetothyriales sp. CBS 135597]
MEGAFITTFSFLGIFAGIANAPNNATAKPRPYRRFLTSALHSRFLYSLSVGLLLSQGLAVILGPKNDLFWSWFPLGPAGFRALLFFITIIVITFLQISTLRIDTPTPSSPVAGFFSTALSFTTASTITLYALSGYWFSAVYTFYSPSMRWITKGGPQTPDRLNERPIYVTCFCVLLGVAHAFRHLYYQHSTLRIPVTPAPTPDVKDQRTHPVADLSTQFKQQAQSIVRRNVVISGAVAVVGPFIYTAFLRQSAWRVQLSFAKLFFNIPRSNARPTGFPPLVGMLPRTFLLAMLLGLTWEISCFLFLAYMATPPSNKGKPLSDFSKDANGTLLTGLRAKRDLVKTFAFWELATIAESQTERRKAIFADIDRPTGPIWASMLDEALKVIKGIDERIEGAAGVKSLQSTNQVPLKSLPKLLPPPDKTNVVARPKAGVSRRAKIAGFLNNEAISIGSSSHPMESPLRNVGRAVERAGHGQASPIERVITAARDSAVGWFFIATNAAAVKGKVLGAPAGNAALIVDAIDSTTRILVASMQDDRYGKAIRGVPLAVKQFTKSITLIDELLKTTPPNDGDNTEVEIIYGRLKAGLTELLSAFQQFLFDTGLSVAELNDAKRAAGQQGIEAENEQQTPVLEEEEQQRLRVVKVPRAGRAGDEEHQQDGWREWGSQRRLTNGQARQPLFTKDNNNISRSSGNDLSGKAVRRRKEMEQVR